MSDVAVRHLRWPDLAEVQEIELQCFPHTAWSPEAFWSEIAHVPETRTYWVAVRGSTVVGYAGLMAVPPDADVQTIAVREDHRRLGVGRQLLDALIDEAQVRRCGSLMLEVAVDSHGAQRLYESTGFEVMARRSSYYGPGRDALVMRLRLPRPDAADSPAGSVGGGR